MSAKHSCKNTEYETFDFGSSGPNRTPTQKGKMNTKEIGRKQDPNAEGKNDHEQKYEKITRKKREKKRDLLEPALKNKKLENQEKYLEFCACFVYFAFVLLLFCFFFAFSFCVFFLPFFSCFLAFFCCSFCCSFLLFLGAAVSVRGVFGDPNL